MSDTKHAPKRHFRVRDIGAKLAAEIAENEAVMSEYKIEKGIPTPKRRPYRAKYPFPHMSVGDSFFAPDNVECVRRAAYAWGVRYKWKFHCSLENGGVRVWRVE